MQVLAINVTTLVRMSRPAPGAAPRTLVRFEPSSDLASRPGEGRDESAFSRRRKLRRDLPGIRRDPHRRGVEPPFQGRRPGVAQSQIRPVLACWEACRAHGHPVGLDSPHAKYFAPGAATAVGRAQRGGTVGGMGDRVAARPGWAERPLIFSGGRVNASAARGVVGSNIQGVPSCAASSFRSPPSHFSVPSAPLRRAAWRAPRRAGSPATWLAITAFSVRPPAVRSAITWPRRRSDPQGSPRLFRFDLEPPRASRGAASIVSLDRGDDSQGRPC